MKIDCKYCDSYYLEDYKGLSYEQKKCSKFDLHIEGFCGYIIKKDNQEVEDLEYTIDYEKRLIDYYTRNEMRTKAFDARQRHDEQQKKLDQIKANNHYKIDVYVPTESERSTTNRKQFITTAECMSCSRYKCKGEF